jgi:SAM-dependent methyltransferase
VDIEPGCDTPAAAADLVGANRDLWDNWTELHVGSDFYDVEGFKAGRDTLDEVEVQGVLEHVGDIQGKTLLHLQCHFGLDTMSWARRGARATGVDFSEKAVAHARHLARELGIPARFFCADVTDTAAVLGQLQGEHFDVVFTSHGVISWLPDLRPWARTIAGALKPGGIFCLVDSHPFCCMFDEEVAEPALTFRYEYFAREALRFEEKGSYAVPDADFEGVSYSWQHTFEEIVTSLAEAGLTIVSLREYPYLFWKWFSWMTKDDAGRYWLPDGMPQIPIMFALAAAKPPLSAD